MDAIPPPALRRKLTGEVHLARLRLAKVESKLVANPAAVAGQAHIALQTAAPSVVIVSPEASKVTVQIGKGVEKLLREKSRRKPRSKSGQS